MLSHLFISNYALIDHLEIDFHKGLTIITGETGAGKSILLGALSLILGDRVDQRVIRNAESKSVIEATFQLSEYGDMSKFFNDNDIDYFKDECILRREISSNGRSRAFINDTPVTLSVLKELTLRLVDIHSQHSNMLLSNPEYQLRIIDGVSKNKDLYNDYVAAYRKYKETRNKLNKLKEVYEKNKQDEDYIRFQYEQIAKLKLERGEDVQLEQDQNRLSNATEIKKVLWGAVSVISEDENSIISALSPIEKALSNIENVGDDLKDVYERVQSCSIELKDISETINALQDDYVDNPQELERINERLNEIYEIENKHKVNSVDELIQLQEEFGQRLSVLDNSDEEIKELEKELAVLTKEAEKAGKLLSDTRKVEGDKFINELKSVAIPLGMKNLQCKINYEQIPLSHSGIDKIQFLFAFNKNQELMPVENTASGGELSRLMLCIKSIIAESIQLPTIIFDEIDTGVSGEIANKMGEMMAKISSKLQIVAITHLPQVAVKGDNHLKVFKTDENDKTVTAIKELSADERIREIAGMLSGEEINQAAIENAKSLLKDKLK